MRIIGLAAILSLAACGSGGEEKQKAKAPPAPASLPAGQWTTQLHVTNYRKMDTGTPGLAMEIGNRVEGGACVSEGAATPPPALFAGGDFTCTFLENSYLRNGRINGFMTCRHPGVDGDVSAAIDGHYTADSLEGIVNFSTALVGDGDFIIATRLSGRRAGACSAAAPAVEGNAQ
jgi:hypothetical protein